MAYSSNWRNLISFFGFGFIDDLKQYEYIVKVWAYNDMQPRTISGLGKFREDSENEKKLNALFDCLAKQLYEFVVNEKTKDTQEFNKWHKNVCNNFCKKFNEICKEYIKEPICFGKAQKIVNVALKYIFCLKGSEKYIKKFESCHMILDRYTYNGDYGINAFYKNEVVPWYNRKNPGKELTPSRLKAWSKLDFNEYSKIQENISVFLSNSSEYVDGNGEPLTPFQAEFYIFNKYNSR